MKKLFSILICMGLIPALASCGGKNEPETEAVANIISPDILITAVDATEVTGVQMVMSPEGVQNDGSARIVKYISSELGAADPITVRFEQFSDTLSTNQVWSDYENNRLTRGDMQFVNNLGEDSYMAYPFISVYDRGCYIKIGAGSGDNDSQRDMLLNLGSRAVAVLEAQVSAEAAADASGNVIK